MKRFVPTMLLMTFLLFLQGRAPSFAQEAAQQKLPAPSWQMLSESAWKTDLGTDKPEVVVLRLSNEEFEKFHSSKKAAMDYIDGHHFLKKKLIEVLFCDVVPAKDGHDWFVIFTHTTRSRAAIVAWQIPREIPN